MNYIGSKLRLMPFLIETIENTVGGFKTFCDLFAGTGIVAMKFNERGYNVVSNDIQYYSFVINKFRLSAKSDSDLFEAKQIAKYLNSLHGRVGFIYQNFCSGSGSGRLYFSDENGKRCDSMRTELEYMRKHNAMSEHMYFWLLGSLINSADSCANTASSYEAFLKQLKPSAQKELELRLLDIPNSVNSGIVYQEEASELLENISGDVLYLDPPYNKRQYSNVYHVLETIARYDDPEIVLKAGKRKDAFKSAFCFKRRAKQALDDLCSKANFKYIFLSYNNEGHMLPNEIMETMSKYGTYGVATTRHRRFERMRYTERRFTTEYLHYIKKG